MKLGYIALLAALAAAPALAEHNHGAAQATVVEGRGTVNAVDAANGTVNISHGPIAAIGWPPMTMDFALENKSLAAKLRPGEAVKFRLKQVDETDYVISSIEEVKQ